MGQKEVERYRPSWIRLLVGRGGVRKERSYADSFSDSLAFLYLITHVDSKVAADWLLVNIDGLPTWWSG